MRRSSSVRIAATAVWVPTLPAADGGGVADYFEECRRGPAECCISSSPTT